MAGALSMDMKNTTLITMLCFLFFPGLINAEDKKPATNVNERYDVESVEITGKDAPKISQTLRDEAQKLVGQKYNEKSANDIAKKIHDELGGRHVAELKVEKGTKPETIKVLFMVIKVHAGSFDISADNMTYTSKEGLSGTASFALTPDVLGTFTFRLANSADALLERYAGYGFGYNKDLKIGEKAVHFKLDFDAYHEKFNPATEAALTQRPDVPGVYRARQNFAPSISVDATKSFTVSAGLSFQRLQFQYPQLHTDAAYAGTASFQYHPKLPKAWGCDQAFNAGYDVRIATRVLESDFVYARHYASANYSLSNKKDAFYAIFFSGITAGTPPLFERFQIGNSEYLSGWNKFDVAPLGGTRVVYGSLDYRHRHFDFFYNVGSVWDENRSSGVKHSLGFGCLFSKWVRASLAFPIRQHHIEPVFTIHFPFLYANAYMKRTP
jgi:hypothetical protein